MDWDIDPPGVERVLRATQSAAEPFSSLGEFYGLNMNGLVQGMNYDVIRVAASAVSEYSTHWAPMIEAAAKQISASLTGAQNATVAYMHGQEDMALNAQQAAARGEIPAPPGSKPHGSTGMVAE
ncbi:DUF6507 family protein [Kribbella sp.]|uniref:DUF6507 family protein n=1 Tax=Kribbella sp. TaxID=1871183 RepID=UPI002D2A8A03|nr:DUF6507 family protein [Kribbella sp.]HZX03893.1 DUF6507 family protein [Kribbella sp.]